MWTLLISCLIFSFLDLVQKNQKQVFKLESLPFLYINLKWSAKFQISQLLIRDSDWLNFIHFSGYKIRLVSRLRKSVDQALTSISTILKFSAQLKQHKIQIKWLKCQLYILQLLQSYCMYELINSAVLNCNINNLFLKTIKRR